MRFLPYHKTAAARAAAVGVLILLDASPLLAGMAGLGSAGPWGSAVNVLTGALTGPIATALGAVAIVVGGLMFAFGEGGSKRALAGIIFGLGMAVNAVAFRDWLF